MVSTKRAPPFLDSMFCDISVGELVEAGHFFLVNCKNNLSSLIWGDVQNKSYSYYVMIDHHVIHTFYIFLLPISSIASSGFHPIFTIDSMQKCEHKVKDKRFSA